MNLLDLLCKKNIVKTILIIVLTILSGIVNIALLVVVNVSITDLINQSNIEYQKICVLILVLILSLCLTRLTMGMTTNLILKIVHEMRMSISTAILNSSFEKMKESHNLLYNLVTKDIAVVSSLGVIITQLITSIVVIVGSFIYLSFLSFELSLIVLLMNLTIILVYLLVSRKSFKFMDVARNEEDVLFFYFKELLDGFKEVKINKQKGIEIVEQSITSSSLKNIKYSNKAHCNIYNLNMIGQFLFYAIIVVIMLACNIDSLGISSSVFINCIITIFYLTSSVSSLSIVIPKVLEGNISAGRVKSVLKLLDYEPFYGEDDVCLRKKMIFKNVKYAYTKENLNSTNNFLIDINCLQMNKGDIIFISGGNGAGKTTLLYLLMGLLKKQEGEIYIDGVEIRDNNYIKLFSPVFSDCYLFDRLYGFTSLETNEVNRYLSLFELDKLISFENKSFSTLKLSTGLRKRLALIVMILEKRPLLILDEFAADQDPYFRNKFYTEIIPYLKNEGYTILAITHDDKYYHIADVLYKMEYGKIEKIR